MQIIEFRIFIVYKSCHPVNVIKEFLILDSVSKAPRSAIEGVQVYSTVRKFAHFPHAFCRLVTLCGI